MNLTKTGKLWKPEFIDNIDCSKCDACERCIMFCPKGVISMEEVNGKIVAKIMNEDLCIGCNVCKEKCPKNAISTREMSV